LGKGSAPPGENGGGNSGKNGKGANVAWVQILDQKGITANKLIEAKVGEKE